MRTNIVIDDVLMEEALTYGGFKTKKEAVEAGLDLIVRRAKQAQIRALKGTLHWEGDLDDMRTKKS